MLSLFLFTKFRGDAPSNIPLIAAHISSLVTGYVNKNVHRMQVQGNDVEPLNVFEG